MARPLTFPLLWDFIPTPDVKVLRSRRLMKQTEDAMHDAAGIVENAPQDLIAWTKSLQQSLWARVGYAPSYEETGLSGRYVALGYSLGAIEMQRRWQRDGEIDGRIWTALVMSAVDAPEQFKGRGQLIALMIFAGYWAVRTGEDGVAEMLKLPLDRLHPGERPATSTAPDSKVDAEEGANAASWTYKRKLENGDLEWGTLHLLHNGELAAKVGARVDSMGTPVTPERQFFSLPLKASDPDTAEDVLQTSGWELERLM